jgi:histidyl-tRNA synthetase
MVVKMGVITKAPRGTLDKLPSQCYKYRYLENKALGVAEYYGFCEIRTPVFEHTELFKRSVGDTSDIVQKEMYTFDDKKGRSLTLKPEGTAPVVRAALENGLLGEALPLKLSYVTNCYRYEAPQSGRYREFTQFGAEVFGADTPVCDAELAATAYDIFTDCGIPDTAYKIEINSIGCSECRKTYQAALKTYYEQFSDKLCGDCHGRLERNPMRLLDCKIPSCGQFKENAPVILDYNCESCSEFFAKFKSALEELEVPYIVNAKIVRGLDYYTNTVFEFVSDTGLVFGAGGRYNGLVKELGGAAVPASGFALGIERLVSLVEKYDGFYTPLTPEIYIGSTGENAAVFALKLACRLRKRGTEADCDIVGKSVKAQMRYADKIKAKYSLIIGDTELESGVGIIKNMQTKETKEVNLNDTDELINELL